MYTHVKICVDFRSKNKQIVASELGVKIFEKIHFGLADKPPADLIHGM